MKSMTLAAVLAVASLASFVVGAVMLGAGIAMPSSSEGGGGSAIFSPGGGGGDQPDKHDFEDDRPVGLYFMTRFWSGTGSLEKAVWYFTEDGRVYRDLEQGFSDDVLAQHQGPHGTAGMDGEDMVIRWSDGKESRSTLEREKDGFSWDMGIFTPVKRFDDESALEGRWQGGNSVSMSGGSASSSNTLELREDGTFAQESAGSVSARSSESTVSGGASGSRSGKWDLDGYSLVLTYADGTTVRGVTFPYDDGDSKRLFFAGVMYKRME
jgi:hypothetical protein